LGLGRTGPSAPSQCNEVQPCWPKRGRKTCRVRGEVRVRVRGEGRVRVTEKKLNMSLG